MTICRKCNEEGGDGLYCNTGSRGTWGRLRVTARPREPRRGALVLSGYHLSSARSWMLRAPETDEVVPKEVDVTFGTLQPKTG